MPATDTVRAARTGATTPSLEHVEGSVSAPVASPSSPDYPVVIHNDTQCYTSAIASPDAPDPEDRLPSLQTPYPSLSIRQQNAIDLLIAGHSNAATARRLGVARLTITRWRLYNHVFQAELNRRRHEVWGCTADPNAITPTGHAPVAGLELIYRKIC